MDKFCPSVDIFCPSVDIFCPRPEITRVRKKNDAPKKNQTGKIVSVFLSLCWFIYIHDDRASISGGDGVLLPSLLLVLREQESSWRNYLSSSIKPLFFSLPIYTHSSTTYPILFWTPFLQGGFKEEVPLKSRRRRVLSLPAHPRRLNGGDPTY